MKQVDYSILYPYQGRNFFDYPENYFYADCSDPGYLKNYISYRESVINKVEAYSVSDTTFCSPKNLEKSNLYMIFEEAEKKILKKKFNLIDKFCLKFEVRKCFYAVYDKKTFKPHKKHGDADNLSYIKFAECLCIAYEYTKSLKYLSTLIKLNDALCTVRFSFPETKVLLHVLKKELEFVQSLK